MCVESAGDRWQRMMTWTGLSLFLSLSGDPCCVLARRNTELIVDGGRTRCPSSLTTRKHLLSKRVPLSTSSCDEEPKRERERERERVVVDKRALKLWRLWRLFHFIQWNLHQWLNRFKIFRLYHFCFLISEFLHAVAILIRVAGFTNGGRLFLQIVASRETQEIDSIGVYFVHN